MLGRSSLSVCTGLLLLSSLAIGSWARAAGTEQRPVHRFLQVAIAPDGKRVASIEGDSSPGTRYPTVRALVIRSVRNAAAVTVALPCGSAPQCWPDSPAWTPDGQRLAFALRAPGSHARSLYTVQADGSGLTKLTDFEGTLEQLRYSRDGRLALLATAAAVKEVGATEAGAPIAGDLAQPQPEQRIAVWSGHELQWESPPDLYVYQYDWLPSGTAFVGTAAPGNGDDNWWIAKLYQFSGGSAARLLYTPSDPRQQLADPTVAPDGKSVAFIGGIMSDFGSTGGDVYRLDLQGAAPPRNLTPAMHASARALGWACDGKLLALLLAGDKTQIASVPELPRDAPKVLLSLADTLHADSGVPWAACPSQVMALDHESFTEAPEIEVEVKGRWHDLTSVNAGEQLRAKVQSIWWKSDGFDVQGWLLLPSSADTTARLPLVTIVHGGPAAATIASFAGAGLTTGLLEAGYAVFYPNPRGSFGQGEAFTLANVRDLGYGDLRDILAGIDAAAKVAPIDPTRLGLFGGSYGGFMTMWAVTQTDRFKAAVAAAGVSDWLSYYGENGIDGWMLPYFGASVYDDPAVYARSSAINFIRNAHTPTFAYVGERDLECPPPQTQEFWHALNALKVPTSVMIYPGEGHGLRDPEHAADALRRTLAWFDRYLKGS